MTLRNKLILALASLTALVLLLGGLGVNALSVSQLQFDTLVHDVDARADAAASLRMAADQRAISVRNLVLVSEAKDAGIVSHHDNTAFCIAGDLGEGLHDLVARFAVERGGRFVADD